MGVKRILGRAGKFAGKAILREAGLIDGSKDLKLSEDVKEDLAEIIYYAMLKALRDFDTESTDPAETEEPVLDQGK